MSTDLDNYERYLLELSTEPSSILRAGLLEAMAGWAGVLTTAASVMHDDEDEAIRWMQVSLLLRAVAQTERGFVLTDPCRTEDWLNHPVLWGLLATTRDDRMRRASYLHSLYEAISPAMPSGAALVLDDIAASEMTVAGAVVAS